MINKISLVILVMILFAACSKEDTQKKEYGDGVFIINQGPFLAGTGTVTFKERDSDSLYQNIFSTANENLFLGNVAQSMITHKNSNYLAINNAGKVVVTDKTSFRLEKTIGGIDQPRYFASNGEKLYLSAWGDTGSNGGVYEIDDSNHSIKNFLDLGNGPEGMIIKDDLLYVAKGGGFKRDSLLLMINLEDNEIVKSIVVGDNPEQIVMGSDGSLYVICNGFSDFLDPTNTAAGSLVKIVNQEIEWSFDLPFGSSRLTIDKANNFAYFIMNGSVVKQDLSKNMLEPKIISSALSFPYALTFDPIDNLLYVADAKDFASQGEVVVFDINDEQVASFPTGIIPGFIYTR